MEITEKLNLETQSEEVFSFQHQKSDDQDYITVEEDSDEDNMIQETTNIEALEISNSHYYSKILSSQAQSSIRININGANHTSPVETNTYVDPINIRTLNQEIPVMPVSKHECDDEVAFEKLN